MPFYNELWESVRGHFVNKDENWIEICKLWLVYLLNITLTLVNCIILIYMHYGVTVASLRISVSLFSGETESR